MSSAPMRRCRWLKVRSTTTPLSAGCTAPVSTCARGSRPDPLQPSRLPPTKCGSTATTYSSPPPRANSNEEITLATLEIRDLHVAVAGQVSAGQHGESQEILRGVDLTVAAGQTHAIMGPNGSGKSTLAYSIAGHPKYQVTSGTVTLDGEDVLAMSVDARARAAPFPPLPYPPDAPRVP